MYLCLRIWRQNHWCVVHSPDDQQRKLLLLPINKKIKRMLRKQWNKEEQRSESRQKEAHHRGFKCFQLSLSYGHNHKNKRSKTHKQTTKQRFDLSRVFFFQNPLKKTKTQNFGKNVNTDLNENNLLEQKKPNPRKHLFVTLRKDESFWIELEREDCVFFFILANYEKEAEERIEKQVLWGALFEEQGISVFMANWYLSGIWCAIVDKSQDNLETKAAVTVCVTPPRKSRSTFFFIIRL